MKKKEFTGQLKRGCQDCHFACFISNRLKCYNRESEFFGQSMRIGTEEEELKPCFIMSNDIYNSTSIFDTTEELIDFLNSPEVLDSLPKKGRPSKEQPKKPKDFC